MPSQSDRRPGVSPGPKEAAELLSLTDAFLFFRRNILLILGMTVVFLVGTFVVLTLLFPAVYEATATLIVTPPTFSSALKPPPLTVQGYQRLLESDKVVAQTRERLAEKGILEATAPLRIGKELESRIFVSRRAEETALAPIIETTARSQSPENAAVIANTWVNVFLDRMAELNEDRTSPTIDFIGEQFSREAEDLHRLEEIEVETQNEFQQTIDEAISRWDRTLSEAAMEWDRKLVGYEKETEDLLASRQIQTRASIESTALERATEIRGVSLGDATEVDELEELKDVNDTIFEIISLRIQLAQTPQYHILEKAISDEALWQTITLSQAPLLELQDATDLGILSRTMLTQEINPVYSELLLRLAGTELKIQGLRPGEREEVRQFSAELEELQRLKGAALSKLLADRAMGLEEMHQSKSLRLMNLRRSKEEAVDALRRQRDMRLAQIRREIKSQSSLVDKLAEVNEQARTARAEQSLSSIDLSSAAVTPAEPQPRGRLMKSVLGGVFGMLVGLFLALTKEVS